MRMIIIGMRLILFLIRVNISFSHILITENLKLQFNTKNLKLRFNIQNLKLKLYKKNKTKKINHALYNQQIL